MKETVTFEIDSALLQAARGLNIDLNEVVVQAVRAKIEHRESIPSDEQKSGEPSPSMISVDLEDADPNTPEPGDGVSGPRPSVMALYQEGEKEFDELYKRLAK